MGVSGLMSFIKQQKGSHRPHNLHDTKVIIDGNNLCNHLFNNCDSKSFFGGDYDVFATSIKNYFEQLLICQITPIVIFDGGNAFKKNETIINRYKNKINKLQKALRKKDFNFSNQTTLMKDVFKQFLTERDIFFAQAIFEADDCVAAIARILDCPVLSFDSDFYIYNVDFIPFPMLKSGFVVASNGHTIMKLCHMYKPQYLTQIYTDLHPTILPLLSALLGNDYSNQSSFENFLETIDVYSFLNQHEKIKLVLNWLRGKNPEKAVEMIMNRLPKSKQSEAYDMIAVSFNVYNSPPPDILELLGIHKNEEKIVKKSSNKPNFVPKKQDHSKIATSFLEKIPDWFKKELYQGLYHGLFINLYSELVTSLGVQVQDFSYPCVSEITFPVILLNQRLLTTGVCEIKPLHYLDRSIDKDDNISFMVKTLDCPKELMEKKLPSLHDLRQLSVVERKKILDEAMGLTDDMKIEEIIQSWQLYFGTALFWLKQDVLPKRNKFHAYALIFSLLHNIIDTKIGPIRSAKDFEKNYGCSYQQLLRNEKDDPQLPLDINLAQAIKEVTKNDCLMAAKEIFIPKYSIDSRLDEDPNNLSVTVIHVYNMLQDCVREFSNLNRLLGLIYETINLSNLLKGTLFYNLYTDFRGRLNIDAYIENILKRSPSLLRVFKILLAKIKNMCDLAGISMFKNIASQKNITLFYPFGG